MDKAQQLGSEHYIDLRAYGLTENQSRVYQCGLQIGTRSVSILARSAGIKRVLCYNILQELCQQGLCSCVTIGNTGYYTMVAPRILGEKLKEKVTLFSNILPSLELLVQQHGEWFKVQTYQWVEWMKTLYDYLLLSKTNFKAFLWADHIDEEFRRYLYDVFLPKRLEKWLSSRTIVSKTDHNEYFADKKNVPLTEVVIIPDSTFDLNSEIVLFDDSKILVACVSSTEMSGLLIQSKNFHDTLDHLFELLRRMFSSTQSLGTE